MQKSDYLRSLSIEKSRSIFDCLQKIDKNKLGFLVVLDNKKLFGVITDGDIRRVLNNSTKKRNLDDIKKSQPMVISENISASKALGFMSEKKITSLLVVSDKDKNKKNKILKGIIHIHFLLQKGI